MPSENCTMCLQRHQFAATCVLAAVISFSATAEKSPSEILAQINSHRGMDWVVAAQPELLRLTSKYPGCGEFHYLLGVVYVIQGEWSEASESYRRAIELGVERELEVDAAHELVCLERTKSGETQVERCRSYAHTYAWHKALAYFGAQDYPEARRWAIVLCELMPDDCNGWEFAASIEVLADRPEVAMGLLQKAIQVCPESDSARLTVLESEVREITRVRLVRAIEHTFRSGQYSTTARLLAYLWRMEPKRVELWFPIGICYMLGGNYSRASEILSVFAKSDSAMEAGLADSLLHQCAVSSAVTATWEGVHDKLRSIESGTSK